MQLEMRCKSTAIRFDKYLSKNNDWMLQLVLFYDPGKKAHPISKESNKFKQELNQQDQPNESTTFTLQTK